MQTLIAHGVAPSDALKLIDDSKKTIIVTYYHTELLDMLKQIRPDAVLFGPDALTTDGEFYELFQVVRDYRKLFTLDVVYCFYELCETPVFYFNIDGHRDISGIETNQADLNIRYGGRAAGKTEAQKDWYRDAYGRQSYPGDNGRVPVDSMTSNDALLPKDQGAPSDLEQKAEATIKACQPCPTLDRQSEDTGEPWEGYDEILKDGKNFPVNNLRRAKPDPMPAKRLTKDQGLKTKRKKSADDDED